MDNTKYETLLLQSRSGCLLHQCASRPMLNKLVLRLATVSTFLLVRLSDTYSRIVPFHHLVLYNKPKHSNPSRECDPTNCKECQLSLSERKLRQNVHDTGDVFTLLLAPHSKPFIGSDPFENPLLCAWAFSASNVDFIWLNAAPHVSLFQDVGLG
jgi:hypothetical protein